MLFWTLWVLLREQTKGPCTDGRSLICWDLVKIWSAVGETKKTDCTCQNTCGWNKEINLNNMNEIYLFILNGVKTLNKILLCASGGGGVLHHHTHNVLSPGKWNFHSEKYRIPTVLHAIPVWWRAFTSHHNRSWLQSLEKMILPGFKTISDRKVFTK